MILVFVFKLALKTCYINVGAQKIESSKLQIYKMILASFQVKDKLAKAQFFWKTFWLANTSMEVMLGMLFWPSAI